MRPLLRRIGCLNSTIFPFSLYCSGTALVLLGAAWCCLVLFWYCFGTALVLLWYCFGAGLVLPWCCLGAALVLLGAALILL
jgi:hypothetical protein